MVQPFLVARASNHNHMEFVMPDYKLRLTVSHWLPIITFCPVNKLPDLIYIYVTFDTFTELYAIRKRIRELVSFKKMFMEDVAKILLENIEEASLVEVRLAAGRHVVKCERVLK